MKNGKLALCVILLFVVAAMAGVGIFYYEKTFASVWIGVGAAFFVASATLPFLMPLWRRLTKSVSIWLSVLCQYVLVGPLVFMLVFGLNYWCSNPSTTDFQKATVSGKFQKAHNKTRRSGRRMIATGEKWYSYYFLITLPDGRTKYVEVPVSEYARKRTGSHIEVEIRRGLFGMDVIRNFRLRGGRQ